MAYLETWRAIETANAVFSFDGWSTSIGALTIDKMTPPDAKSDRHSVIVSVIMRITLKDGTYREDVGVGSHDNKILSSALENAKKEAVSDALKRTARQFGNALGNSIYDKLHATHEVKAKKERDQKEREAGRGNTLTLPKGSITFAGVRQNLKNHIQEMESYSGSTAAHQAGAPSAGSSSMTSPNGHAPNGTSNTSASTTSSLSSAHHSGMGGATASHIPSSATAATPSSYTTPTPQTAPNTYNTPQNSASPFGTSRATPVGTSNPIQSPPPSTGLVSPHNTPVGANTAAPSPFGLGSSSPFKGAQNQQNNHSSPSNGLPTSKHAPSTTSNGLAATNTVHQPVAASNAAQKTNAAVSELLADLGDDDDFAMMESAVMVERKKDMKEAYGSPTSTSLHPSTASTAATHTLSPIGSSSPLAVPSSPTASTPSTAGQGLGGGNTSLPPLPSSLAPSPSSSPMQALPSSTSSSVSTVPSGAPPLTAEQKAAQIADATSALMDFDEFE